MALHFKNKEAYRKWLAYGFIHKKFHGKQGIYIQGKIHRVVHAEHGAHGEYSIHEFHPDGTYIKTHNFRNEIKGLKTDLSRNRKSGSGKYGFSRSYGFGNIMSGKLPSGYGREGILHSKDGIKMPKLDLKI